MSAKTKRSTWQWITIFVLAGAFVVVLLTSRDEIGKTIDVLSGVDVRIIALLPLLQLTSYFCIANYYRSFLAAFKSRVGLGEMYRMVIALYFVEQVLPSGGASGITYIAYILRNIASVGTTTLVQLGRYMLSYSSYILVLASAVLLLMRGADNNGRALTIASVLLVSLIANVFITVWILRSPRAINAVVGSITRMVNRLAALVRRAPEKLLKQEAITKNLEEFHDGVTTIFRTRRAIFRPFVAMTCSTIIQLTIVYLSFVAIGELINPGVVFVSFALANLVGIISVIPGDVGVHEATMIFVLSASGVEPSVAASATLLYRVYNKIIMLGIGFFFYAKYLKPAENNG